MKPTSRIVHTLTYLMLGGLGVVFAFITFALVRPYNDVRFPQGNVGTVEPQTVKEGGVVTVTYPAYCNDNQDVMVQRWADRYYNGKVVASFSLPPIQFFNKGNGLVCFEPSVSRVTLPNYVAAQSADTAVFRLRLITIYKPNPIRTVRVESFTQTFTVTP